MRPSGAIYCVAHQKRNNPPKVALRAPARLHIECRGMFEARFQSFEDPQATPTGPRLAALRGELSRRGFSGFILPRADRHQNEFVPPSEERLAWVTGFTGSAGSAVVLADKAALFVDGRYTLQASHQVDASLFEIVNVGETSAETWIE